MDKLLLEGLEFYGFHGVLPEEKKLGQKFVVSLELRLDLSTAGHSDNYKDTVNYAEVFEKVKNIVTVEKFNLLEALAETISRKLLKDYNLLKEIKVKVEKPQAPVAGIFNYMAAEITRVRDGEA